MKYLENEIKVLNIDVEKTLKVLKDLWVLIVYDDFRVITGYDTKDKSLRDQGIQLKITEEWTVKMSLDYVHESWKVVSIKNKLWRKSEMEGTLKILWFHPVAKVKVRRISLEFKWSDFDIDIFPNIPPFIEIDSDKPESIETMISKLWLDEHLKVTYSTIKVFEKYWFDYYDIFKI